MIILFATSNMNYTLELKNLLAYFLFQFVQHTTVKVHVNVWILWQGIVLDTSANVSKSGQGGAVSGVKNRLKMFCFHDLYLD